MNREELLQSIIDWYEKLERASYDFRQAAMNCVAKQNEIDLARARLLNGGSIVGKNAEMREAEMRMMLTDEYDELLMLEVKRDVLYAEKEMAEIGVDRIRAVLRVYELSEEVFKHV